MYYSNKIRELLSTKYRSPVAENQKDLKTTMKLK